jgi:hypothetical protein
MHGSDASCAKPRGWVVARRPGHWIDTSWLFVADDFEGGIWLISIWYELLGPILTNVIPAFQMRKDQ